MKVLFLSTSDIRGGASLGSYKLLNALAEQGLEVSAFVQEKEGDSPLIKTFVTPLTQNFARVRKYLDLWWLYKRYPYRERAPFSVHWLPDSLRKIVRELAPDIIHLHWISAGFMRIETLPKFKARLVWTFHDMWPFTGGCHYSNDCTAFRDHCGHCPILKSNRYRDLAYGIFRRKQKSWHNAKMRVVALSRWMAREARSSALFRDAKIDIISNGVDTNVFRPYEKDLARRLLNLPLKQRLILFGAEHATKDPRKGFSYLQDALGILHKDFDRSHFHLVVFGDSGPSKGAGQVPFPTHYLGRLNDPLSLAFAYSASDVFIAPSIQENMANTVLESMACGTPVVSFNIGGMPDMISHRIDGWLAEPLKAFDLARGIEFVLKDTEDGELGRSARHTILERFDIRKVAMKYIELYNNLLADSEY